MPLPHNLNELGLQDAVRSIFRRSYPVYLLPTDVRDTLVSAGTFGPASKRLLTTVHTAISRMKDELEEESRPGEKRAHRSVLLVSDPPHPIHHPGPIAKVTR